MFLSFWSSMTLGVPSVFCLYSGLYAGGVLLFAAMVASSYYHCKEEDIFHLIFDVMCVILVIAFVVHIAMNASIALTYMNLIAIFWAFIAFYFWFSAPSGIENYDHIEHKEIWEEYDWKHSLWHVTISLSLLSLAYSFVYTDLKKEETYLVRRIHHIDTIHQHVIERKEKVIGYIRNQHKHVVGYVRKISPNLEVLYM